MFLKIEPMLDDKQKNDEPYFLYSEFLFCAGNKAADDFQELRCFLKLVIYKADKKKDASGVHTQRVSLFAGQRSRWQFLATPLGTSFFVSYKSYNLHHIH